MEESMKILSFAQALSLGFQPRKYGTSVPEGEFIARLDLRMWGKSVKLRCFFTNMKTGEKFSLFAYRSHSGKEHIVQRPDGKAHHAYTPEDGVFDFAEDDLGGRQFRLVMRQGARGKILWSSAELLPVDDSRTGEIACPSRYSASKRKTWGDKR